jgi:alpha-glucosidase
MWLAAACGSAPASGDASGLDGMDAAGGDGGLPNQAPDTLVDSGGDADATMEAAEAGGEAGTDALAETSVGPWVEILPSGNRVVAHCQGFDLAAQVLDKGMVRLRYAPPGKADENFSYAVVQQEWGAVAVTYGVAGSGFRMQTALLDLEFAEGDCRLTVRDDQGRLLVEEPAGAGYQTGSEVRDGIQAETVSLIRGTPAEERFYGFGEKTGALNKRGRSLTFWNTDTPGYSPDADPLYQSIPFFMGLRDGVAYGVLLDNSFRLRFDMAASVPDGYSMTAFGGEIDTYLIAGPTLAQVLDRYTRLTGRPAFPPRWTLGYHQCRWSYYPDAKVLDICQQFRAHAIPADGIWLDIDYMDGFRSWTWSPEGFPDPSGLVAAVGKIGFKVSAIIDPGLKADPGWDVYQQGVSGGHFLPGEAGQPYLGAVWPGPAVFPDFTRSETRQWWGTLVSRLTDHGVKGIWLDMNEPASFVEEDAWTLPGWVQANGDGHPTSMDEIHNVYALAENLATYAGLMQAVPGARPFLLTRAGFAGIQRYAAVWTGDAASDMPALQQTVPMLLGLGLSGVPMVGSDVGGWEGGGGGELYARWIEVGAISPLFRSHVQTGAPDQDPWSFGMEVEDISRIHIQERYRLFPYVYSLMRLAAASGAPILRPLVYEFQNDPAVWDESYEAMLGPWLLYAPVLEAGADTSAVRLPAGHWLEYHSGALFQGPATIQVSVTLQALPVFMREGAIVPRGPLMQWSDQKPLSPLGLDIYPGPGASTFTLYEDDGVSLDHQTGEFSELTYTLQATASGATLKAGPRSGTYAPPPRRLEIRLRPVHEGAAAVLLAAAGTPDQTLPQFASLEALEAAQAGWFYDGNELALHVVLPDQADFSLVMEYDPAIDDPAPPVLVPVKVHVPPGTPLEPPVYIATSGAGWAHQPLLWSAEPNTAYGIVPVPRGEWFYYKYTRGDWTTVEKWAGCLEAKNRYAFGTAHPVKEDTVATWADGCP